MKLPSIRLTLRPDELELLYLRIGSEDNLVAVISFQYCLIKPTRDLYKSDLDIIGDDVELSIGSLLMYRISSTIAISALLMPCCAHDLSI